ncbi:uncharacterized protein LOC135376027 isoform X2 [Ornithodoros turicata]|uniref:uncharacterized protein LOC135376027 isoform X2 n=1 Tax=Ornithodoros turicata TaxID=34597 RepID=UPI003139C948
MSRVPLMLSYSITATRRPLTDEELTKLAETRPITVLFVGDRSYSTISKEQFLIYAQSQLNMINAAFAENNIKLKMKVYDTYVLNEEQERNHLVEIPGRQFQSIDSERTSERLKGRIVEYPGVNESDIVYVFTRKLLSKEGSQQTSWDWYEDKTGPCGGRLLPNIYYDPPFSYLAVTHCMWSNTLVRIVNTSECDDMHLDQCYQHLIPAYKDDLNRSLCYTTTDTQNAPTFSGVVGFNVDNFCKASALIDGLTAPGQACFDDDDALCFLKKCGKKYSEIKALSRRNWNLPDSHYDEMDACAKYP